MPDPSCPQCDGTGWKQVARGEVSGVERCECHQPRRADSLLAEAGIPARYEKASFESFDLHRQNPPVYENLSRIILDAKVYADQYPWTEKRGLLFLGHPGVGKTHLAVAVLKRLIERGFECVFLDYQALLETIRRGYDRECGAAAREAYQTALDTEVILLDDLGAHRVTDWVNDTVFAIINHRYNAKKATLVTTNLPDRDVAPSGNLTRDTLADRIGASARSRLFEMCKLLRITATEDYRLRGVR
jgi:DNA replication protein DnaC